MASVTRLTAPPPGTRRARAGSSARPAAASRIQPDLGSWHHHAGRPAALADRAQARSGPTDG
jgi:hypothetical protein